MSRPKPSKPLITWAWILFPFALLYGGITWIRNRLFDWGFFSSHRFDFPVISVGNLSVGGTGKTPHVEYLVRRLKDKYVPAVMSRGYKRKTRGFHLADGQSNAATLGDEPMQYRIKFPELIVSVAEQRLEGIPKLLQACPEVEVVILDDAYQHRRVQPGLHILVSSFDRPFTRDFLLPMGRLREGRGESRRADIMVISKCPKDLSEEEMLAWKEEISADAHQEVYFSSIQYGEPYGLWSGEPLELENKSLFLVTGIAQPASLQKHLMSLTDDLHIQSYSDHYDFSPKDIRAWHQRWISSENGNMLMVTTEKDAARLRMHRKLLESIGLEFAVVPMEVVFLGDGEEGIWKRIYQYIETGKVH